MADTSFYSIENGHNVRQIRILSVGSLVSKPPTKEKRISIKVRMPLTGTVNMGAPGWLDNAYTYVAQNHDMVTPNIEFKGFSIGFNADNLFGAEGFNGQDCTMKGFQIFECGDSENPDVVMEFGIRMSFATKRWDWLGQYVGDDVWAKFTPAEAGTAQVDTEEDGTDLDDGENDEGDSEPEAEVVSEDPRITVMPPPKKSGPKELAAFHEKEAEKEAKETIQRPRGFSKPLHQGNLDAEF